MKVLMIGMDGAHLEAFNRGWTPYIKSLLDKGTSLNVQNDLISRGWLEIATGEHASKTGAMYDNPKVHSTLEWSYSFSLNNIPNIGTSVKPIWQALNEKGFSVGIMNLPTVFPAPKVNGFFVSGGGGGAPVVEKPIESLCYPKDILPLLTNNGYIVDERIPQLVAEKKLKTTDKIFEKLAKKNNARTTSFISLANKFSIDFGFVVYKTSSVTAETILLPELNRDHASPEDNAIAKDLKNYYKKFDEEIRRLHQAFPETELLFVSDHGSITRSYTVNINILLQEHGYQAINNNKNAKKRVINKIKKIMPFSIKMALKKINTINRTVTTNLNFESSNTKAFSHTKNDWSHGIFVNDIERFGGPVNTDKIDLMINEITQIINNDNRLKAHSIEATPTKKLYPDKLAHFPDIILHMPSGYLTNEYHDELISEFTPSSSIDGLTGVLRGDILSIKSREPLAVVVGPTVEAAADKTNKKDLTAIYEIVNSVFNTNP